VKGTKGKGKNNKEIEKKVTEEDDEEAKEKRKLAERMKDPEFMPGFKVHVQG